MKMMFKPRKDPAITLLEVLLVLAAVAILAGLVVPWIFAGRAKANRIRCVNNLKNVGLGFRIFSTDHNGQYPWKLSGTNGTKDLLSDPTAVVRHFQFISNEITTPLILGCPADTERRRVSRFADFGLNNLSYFLGLLASDTQPLSVLSGDRNLTTNGTDVGPGLLLLGTNLNAGFSPKIHHSSGNVGLGDGSVQQFTSGRLQSSVVATAVASSNAVNRLLIP